MKNETKNLKHPSLLQIRYLLELEKIAGQRGCVAAVADICGVSHGPVSRFFKECTGYGYLTERYEFTELGNKALSAYKKILKNVEAYLERQGIPEEEMTDKLRQLVENVDYELLMTIVRSDTQVQKHDCHEPQEESAPYFLRHVLEQGKYEVEIAIHQLSKGNGKTELSMAHRGFLHRALIRHNTRGSWLELTICPMVARSRIDGSEMTGHLSSLKYEKQGLLYDAEIRDGKLRIPLDSCHFQKNHRGNIRGVLPITVCCSVGQAHMPESTALLTFWL